MKIKNIFELFLFMGLFMVISCATDSEKEPVYETALHLRALKIDSMDLHAQREKIKDKMKEKECESISGNDQKTQTSTPNDKTSTGNTQEMDSAKTRLCAALWQKLDSIQAKIDSNLEEIKIVAELNSVVTPPDDGDTDPPCPLEAECNYSELQAILVNGEINFKIAFFTEEGDPIDGILKTEELKNSFIKHVINKDLRGNFTVRVEKISEAFKNGTQYEFKMKFPDPKK